MDAYPTHSDWPKCAVPACTNRCCLRLKSRYCWPHTPGSASDARQNLHESQQDGVDSAVEAQ
jgi:hypothetical protein